MTSKPQIIQHVQKSLNVTVYDVKWIPFSAKFVILGSHARGTGSIQVYQLNQGKLDLVSESEKHSPFKCGTFGASFLEERHLATGDFDGRVSLWNLDKIELPVWTSKGHDAIINAIDGVGGVQGGGAPEIVTGSRDGKVFLWDPRTNKAVVSLAPPPDQAVDCWSVAFGNSYDSDRCVCSGYDNGDLKMFDLRMNTIKWEVNVGNGICSIEFDRKDIEMNKMVVTTLEAKFKVFDLRTFHSKLGFASLTQQAHESTVWVGKHLPQNRDIWMTTGGNGSMNLWRYSYPGQRKRKEIDSEEEVGIVGSCELLSSTAMSTQPILCFDWNSDKEGLCVCGSLDQTVRVGIVTKLKNY